MSVSKNKKNVGSLSMTYISHVVMYIKYMFFIDYGLFPYIRKIIAYLNIVLFLINYIRPVGPLIELLSGSKSCLIMKTYI